MVQQHVPIIDLGPLDSSDARARVALAGRVDRVLTAIGFFVVTGHGVDWTRVEETDAVCRRFFDLPAGVKQQVANEGTPFRGDVGYGGENLAYTEDQVSPPDWKENFINCNADARIECLRTCQGPGNPPRHRPIGAGEHRRMKLTKSAAPVNAAQGR